jgi:hypothetical protein
MLNTCFTRSLMVDVSCISLIAFLFPGICRAIFFITVSGIPVVLGAVMPGIMSEKLDFKNGKTR